MTVLSLVTPIADSLHVRLTDLGVRSYLNTARGNDKKFKQYATSIHNMLNRNPELSAPLADLNKVLAVLANGKNMDDLLEAQRLLKAGAGRKPMVVTVEPCVSPAAKCSKRSEAAKKASATRKANKLAAQALFVEAAVTAFDAELGVN